LCPRYNFFILLSFFCGGGGKKKQERATQERATILAEGMRQSGRRNEAARASEASPNVINVIFEIARDYQDFKKNFFKKN